MRLIITGRHLEITDAIRGYVEKKLGHVTKYFEQILEIDVTLSVEHTNSEGDKHIADVLLFANQKKIKATADDKDLYAAIDEVADLVEKQVKKHKEKMKRRQHHRENVKEKLAKKANQPKAVKEESVIKSTLISSKPMDIEEAILQMDSMGEDFYAYMNHDTENLNVVYKKKDGSYGHISPMWKK
ncbi:MAG: ribosome hibernation-promoting factor, HPF/YfiA family [Fusobacteriota bacterium]